MEHYELKFRRSGVPLDRKSIAAAERELGLAIPQPYVELLLRTNGGNPSPAYLPYPGQATKVDHFYPIDELVKVCWHHRAESGLPADLLPIAELDDGDSVVLLDCAETDAGALFFWVKPSKFGFRRNDPDYDNLAQLYFKVDLLDQKFGPATNRNDRDGMFCQLYYASSNPAQGSKLASKYTADGYDINFVPPTFRHPIFGAIDAEAYDVAATFIGLGTASTHTDPLHDHASVTKRLFTEQKRWQGMLEASTEEKYNTGIGMAKRRLGQIAEAISAAEAVG